MNNKQIQKEMQELSSKLNKLNEDYYKNSVSSVEDAEYDIMMNRLRKLETEFPEFIIFDSPSQTVGSSVDESKFTKVKHVPEKMLSLDNAFNLEDYNTFVKKVIKGLGEQPTQVVVEQKIDGLSLSVEYKDGKLFKAITRGNGEFGEDVTENALEIEHIPKNVDDTSNFVVRGEVYLSMSKFLLINEKRKQSGLQSFANPRNAASGTMRQIDSVVVRERSLNLFAYQALSMEGGNK
ncbi:MAG: hypothetical protein DRP42_06060 [Tenericutes bacterium]|nr:MAG: hypothetical protein DRP42_06060 [Mycoplasmatota bacterium]